MGKFVVGVLLGVGLGVIPFFFIHEGTPPPEEPVVALDLNDQLAKIQIIENPSDKKRASKEFLEKISKLLMVDITCH